ncbi:MAG: DivIVA domain-containing protein [Armatimonadetes bacterium]|nr:DivIVA domain-containing protein [Armatimonadota bacterium]
MSWVRGMAITPVDITHTRFRTSLRGYNKQDVDAFVRAVREALEEALNERSELQRKVDSLRDELERIRKIESTMSHALTIAQKSADDLRANAHRQAEMILREAEQERVRMTIDTQKEVEGLRAEIGRLQAVRDRFAAELRATVSAFQELLNRRLIAARELPESAAQEACAEEENTGVQPAASDVQEVA